MTWLDHLVCSLVDQAAIQSVPVTCACGRTAESAQVAHEKWWAEFVTGWQCPGCVADAVEARGWVHDPDDDRPTPEELHRRIAREVLKGDDLHAELDRLLVDCNEAMAEREDLRDHLAAVLELVRRTGGYMSAEDQDVIRAAREAVR